MIHSRVAYVSTCGAGHLNTLQSLWKEQGEGRLFLLRFSDEPIPFTNEPDVVVLTCNQKKPSENAAVFNEVRRQHLQAPLHVWLHDYRPTMIVYDFFCIEARIISRVLGVPAICSIPATLKPDETDTCSDAVLVKEHFYWIWREPYPVAIGPVAFLGPRPLEKKHSYPGYSSPYYFKKRVVVTFGTVIPHYEGCKERLAHLMIQLEELVVAKKEDTFFIFAGLEGTDGKNCEFLFGAKQCDLTDIFDRFHPDLLIFHGGGNTYSEALAARVPRMLVCPFFGDQFETARQEGNVYSGNLLEDVERVKEHNYSSLSATIKLNVPFKDRFPHFFRPGDLLFGHRRHRNALQKAFPHIDFHLDHYRPFAEFAHPELGELPAIADVYNDELGLLQGPLSGDDTPYHKRLFDVAMFRNAIQHRVAHLPEEYRLVHYCVEIIELTIRKWNGRIHFVLGLEHEMGPATRIELDHIEKQWKDFSDAVIFYNVEGERVPAPWSCPAKPTPPPKPPKPEVSGIPLKENALIHPLMTIPGRMPLVWGREKSYVSTLEKVSQRHLPLLDHYGWRTGYLDQADLQRLQQALLPTWTVSVNWCHQRVWYYYYTKEHTEVQIWPWTYLHHFYLDQAGIATDSNRQFEMQKSIEEK